MADDGGDRDGDGDATASGGLKNAISALLKRTGGVEFNWITRLHPLVVLVIAGDAVRSAVVAFCGRALFHNYVLQYFDVVLHWQDEDPELRGAIRSNTELWGQAAGKHQFEFSAFLMNFHVSLLPRFFRALQLERKLCCKGN